MDDVTNEQRAAWAAEAVDLFAETTGLTRGGEDTQTIVGDLLCDLMHYCNQRGVDFATCVHNAASNYQEELDEEKSAVPGEPQ